ncbi:hypothetical protein BKA81DRAFT_373866 [Phyllosticta paracitricarpa]
MDEARSSQANSVLRQISAKAFSYHQRPLSSVVYSLSNSTTAIREDFPCPASQVSTAAPGFLRIPGHARRFVFELIHVDGRHIASFINSIKPGASPVRSFSLHPFSFLDLNSGSVAYLASWRLVSTENNCPVSPSRRASPLLFALRLCLLVAFREQALSGLL